MPHTKFLQNILSSFGEKVDFIDFVILNIGGHLGLSIRLNFIILKPCSLFMLQGEFVNHGCCDFRELVILMELNARVDVLISGPT